MSPKTVDASAVHETPKAMGDDTATRERSGAVMPEAGEDNGICAVTLRMWIAKALQKKQISLPYAVQLMRFVDTAEQREIETAQRLQSWRLRCEEAGMHLFGRR